MKVYLHVIIFLCLGMSQDVHLWISSIEDNVLELSFKSNAPIYGFDFKINSYTDNVLPIDYIEESFTNGENSEIAYTINAGGGSVAQNNFHCFTDGENRFIGVSLANNFLPATDSTIMMSIPFSTNQENENYMIDSPIFFSKDENYNLIDLDVEYGLIEYQSGWPFNDTDKILGAPAIDDLNEDGFDEIIFCDYFGNVFITDYAGQLLHTFNTGNQIWGSPAIADLNNDNIKELIITSKDQKLYILNHQGELLMEYDANQYLLGTPAIGNIDDDEELEIIFGGYSNQGKIFAINMDGTDVSGFPVMINEKIQRGVALADFNQNNLDDIVFGTDSGNIYLLYDSGEIAFSINVDDDIRCAPVIIKMVDEHLIITGSRDDHLYAINANGEIKFSYDTGDKIDSSPVVLDYQEQIIIFFGSANGYLYAIDTNGNDLTGWPIDIGNAIESSPAIADFNGDDIPEIVVTSTSNDLKIYNFDGTTYKNIPIVFEFPFSGNPEIKDVDLDGDLEIFIGSTNGMIGVDIKDINGEVNSYWHQFRGGLTRNGYIEVEQFLHTDYDDIRTKFLLTDIYPNPFNPFTNINYYIPEGSIIEISIHDIMGKKIKTIKKGFVNQGHHSLIWDAANFASGKYLVYLSTENIKLSKIITLIK